MERGCALLLEQIDGAVAGGVDLVQIRERDLEAGELARLVRAAVARASGSATRIVVNDRVDVAIACAVAGVHLRESSLPATLVRRLAPGLLIGRSVHGTDSAIAAAAVDYLIAGTVFPTESKPTLGLQGLAEIVRAAKGVPILAIGGVSATNVQQVIAAGASGIAAIGAFMPAPSAADIRVAVEKSVEKMRLAFDSNSTVS